MGWFCWCCLYNGVKSGDVDLGYTVNEDGTIHIENRNACEVVIEKQHREACIMGMSLVFSCMLTNYRLFKIVYYPLYPLSSPR